MSAQPNLPRKKNNVRLHRAERTKTLEIHDETGHLWAVSYADFLMVLLSFFVIFFSVDDKKRESVIRRIQIAGGAETRAPDAVPAQTISKNDFASLKNNLSQRYKLEPADDEKLIIALPGDLFKSGSVQLTRAGRSAVSDLLNLLTPYREQLQLTFVGHTDSRPLSTPRSHLLDNYDLSVLRATAALRVALNLGYSPHLVSAQGTADQVRSNRTVSLVVSSGRESL